MNLHKAEAVEPAIDCSQRAQILTKRAVNLHGKKQKKEQYSQLPEKQSPSLTAKRFVCRQQGDGSKQCAGGTDIFAECGNLGKSVKQKRGANPHKEKQRYVLSVFQDMVQGQLLFLMKNRYLVQKVLYQPKGAQPSADKAPQKAAKQKEKAQSRKGNLESLLIEQSLESSDGTGGDGTGAGITVQSRNTGVFQLPLINFSTQKSVHISICKNGKNKLYRQPQFLHIYPFIHITVRQL